MITFLETLNISNIKPLSGFHNEIYEGVYNQDPIVIRVSNRRSKEAILQEITVLNKIKNAVNIAEPYAVNNAYVMTHEGKTIAFFKKISGLNWHETTLTNETHYLAGRALGNLHNALQTQKDIRRESFDHHPDITLLSNLNPIYKNEAQSLINELKNVETTDKEYGLIHGDYLFSNLLYHNHDVTIIDFDDIEYNYYLYDVAVYLFYLLLGGNPASIDIESNIEVFKHFINGYKSVNTKTYLDFTKIQLMFRLRQLKLLATIKTKFDYKHIGPWQTAYLELCDRQLKHNEDFVPIDYHKIVQSL